MLQRTEDLCKKHDQSSLDSPHQAIVPDVQRGEGPCLGSNTSSPVLVAPQTPELPAVLAMPCGGISAARCCTHREIAAIMSGLPPISRTLASAGIKNARSVDLAF